MRDPGSMLLAILTFCAVIGFLLRFFPSKQKAKPSSKTTDDLLALIAAQNEVLLRRVVNTPPPAPPPLPPEPPSYKMLTAEEGFAEWATHCIIKESSAKGFFTEEAYTPYSLFCEQKNADRLHIQTFGSRMKEYVESIGGRVGKVGKTRFYDVRLASYLGASQPLLRPANDI